MWNSLGGERAAEFSFYATAIANLVETCGQNETIEELKQHSLAIAMTVIAKENEAAEEMLLKKEETSKVLPAPGADVS